uniref:Tight junction protein ZO-1 n=1 Tax=Syphacia muris TaxID=451379 RepID=A0A0N5A8Y0_9BILA
MELSKVGFGIAVSGGCDNPHFTSGDPAVVVSDVIPTGPAWGLVRVNDRILSANGISLENAEYAAAVKIMKESQQLNMIVKRRAPVPLMEFEQRTLKFTLTKSKKKEDFGIVLGCKFYIKEITNRKLAEKEPGLKEGDTILRINGQSVDGITIDEATKWLTRSREKLSLVIQRDVRTGTSRWPSQNTIYERLGSVSTTPRHSPSPMHMSHHYPVSQPSTAEIINNSTISNSRWSQSQSEYPSTEYGNYCKRNGSVTSNHGPGENDVRTIRFRKDGGSLGVRVIGGNHVGIYVSAVQEDSPAALNTIRPGDRILSVNGKSMVGVTREEVVRHLLSLNDNVTIGVQYSPIEFEKVRSNQLGDRFYIRTHFSHQKVSNQLELTFHNGDIFLVTDTLFGGTVGYWQATRKYSSMENSTGSTETKGVIPNAEGKICWKKYYALQSRSTFFRRKLKERRTKSLNRNVIDDFTFPEGNSDTTLPAYERVTLRQPPFQRPVVLYGPLADVARKMLLANFALCFATPNGDGIIRLSSIDAVISSNKHCLLDVSPASVERLQLAQYAPIVILIDVDSRSRIRELRNKAGASLVSSRKLMEQTHKIKKYYSHVLTAMLDATKEDGWFAALRQLIAHLQDRSVWMPEFPLSANLNDVFLVPIDSDVDSLKGVRIILLIVNFSFNNASLSNKGDLLSIKPKIVDTEEQDTFQEDKTTDDEKSQGRVNNVESSPATVKETQHEEDDATIIEHVLDVVDSGGGTLNCPQSGVMLIIPEGAIKEGVKQEIYVKVCRANGNNSRPPLDESRGESLMSPLVMCGPQNLQFKKPVELRLPHSASNNGENWSFALKSGTGKQWEQISLDENTSSVVTDKFVSVKINHF